MKVLITGINGFIGKHLSAALREKGHFVYGIDIGDSSGDVLDKEAVKKAMEGAETVIHLAALTSHQDIVGNKFKALEINFLGTKNVLDAFSESKTAKKFIYSSTGKVYGDIKFLPITEEHPLLPLNILGKSKLITEKLIDFYSKDSQKSFVIFRIFNVFGQGQRESFIVPNILSQINNSGKVELGNTKPRRDYVYIKDVARAFVLALENEIGPGISYFNICSGKAVNVEEIVSLMSKIKNKKIEINIDQGAFIRKDEKEIEYGSYEKIKNKLGWEPEYSLKKGLEEIINVKI